MTSVSTIRSRAARPELTLLERGEMFQQLAENIDQVLWMTDLSRSGMLYVSPAYEIIWGRTVKSLLDSSCSWLETIHPEDRGRIMQASSRQSDGSYREEYRIVRPDGEIRWIQDRAFPIHDANGAVFRIAGVARDITERVRAEAELRKLSDVIERSPMAMVIANRERMVEYVNRAVLDMTGFTRHEVLGQRTSMFRSAATPDSTYDSIIAQVCAGRPWQGEHLIKHKTGSDVPVSGVWAPLFDAEGHVTHMVLVGRDITEERRTEVEHDRLRRQLMQAQKMEAIGQLAGGIAHDFNNILTAILGYGNLALQRYGSATGSKLNEYLKGVVGAGERGRDLVAQLLTYSRTEPEQSATPVNLEPLVRDTIAMLAASIPASVVIEVEADAAVPAVLLAPVDLQQILMNLAINARDATNECGHMRIRLRQSRHGGVECAACRRPVQGEFVELSVNDDGQGIDVESLSRIFDPFYTTKEPGRGTGLGLSVVAGVVHKAGGHILLESRADAGTTVRVCLPIAREGGTLPVALPDASATAVTESAGSGRVLLVDDEPIVARFLGELLESHGYRVTTFNNSVAALRCFESNPLAFDLVLTDQTMPGLTGVDLTRAILARRPGMPVILASGYSSSVNAATAREIGARAFVPKPVSAGKLLPLMGRVISGLPEA